MHKNEKVNDKNLKRSFNVQLFQTKNGELLNLYSYKITVCLFFMIYTFYKLCQDYLNGNEETRVSVNVFLTLPCKNPNNLTKSKLFIIYISLVQIHVVFLSWVVVLWHQHSYPKWTSQDKICSLMWYNVQFLFTLFRYFYIFVSVKIMHAYPFSVFICVIRKLRLIILRYTHAFISLSQHQIYII